MLEILYICLNFRFSVDAMFNFLKMSLHAKALDLPGATHAEDTLYLWG